MRSMGPKDLGNAQPIPLSKTVPEELGPDLTFFPTYPYSLSASACPTNSMSPTSTLEVSSMRLWVSPFMFLPK